MARTATITREEILAGALNLIRAKGHEQLNTRSLAQQLGCSTQPIMYCFKSMEDLRQETYRAIDELHSAFLLDGIDEASDPLLQLGLNYVRFAACEPHFFRFLFQTNGLGVHGMDSLANDPAIAPIVAIVAEEADLDEQSCHQAFLALFACAHGFASLLANNALPYDENLVADALTSTFIGSVANQKGSDA